MSIVYVKLDRSSPSYADARQVCEAAFKAAYPANNFSENVRADGLVSWVKTVSGHGVTSPAVLDSATYEQRVAKVVADVYASKWAPTDEIPVIKK